MILVTGGAGFIGSHVAETLLKQGEKVVVIDTVNDYYNVKQKEANLAILKKFENFTFIKQDIRDFEALKQLFLKYQFKKVINLAAYAGVRYSIEAPLLYQSTNVQGTLNLLECCKEFKIDIFVNASSSSVYGSRTNVPFKETDRVDKQVSPYAASKRSAELFCSVYNELFNMNIVCLRFFTVYGPRGRPDMAPYKFPKWIKEGKPLLKFGDGSSQRDYTYVTDIVQGILASLNVKGFEIINLGNNKPISLNEFIATIEEIVGKKAIIKQMPMQQGDVPITYADISKAKKLLNFKPNTSLKEGLRAQYEWMKDG